MKNWNGARSLSIPCGFSVGAIVLLLGVLTSPALAIEGLPGSTWGSVSQDADDIEGTGAIGYLNQGVDWTTLPGGVVLNTFAEFRYRLREGNKTYNNAYGPALGLELRKWSFHLGMDYYWQRFPELDESSNRLRYYLSWYYDWDLKR